MFKKNVAKKSLIDALDVFLKALIVLFMTAIVALLLVIGIYWTPIITVIVCLLVLFLAIFLMIWYDNSTYR